MESRNATPAVGDAARGPGSEGRDDDAPPSSGPGWHPQARGEAGLGGAGDSDGCGAPEAFGSWSWLANGVGGTGGESRFESFLSTGGEEGATGESKFDSFLSISGGGGSFSNKREGNGLENKNEEVSEALMNTLLTSSVESWSVARLARGEDQHAWWEAVYRSDHEKSKELIRDGADVNAQVPFTLSRFEGQTAMHIYASRGEVEMVQHLIKAKATPSLSHQVPPNGVYPGATPLHAAISSGHFETVKLLVDSKSSLEPKDDELCAPFGRAVALGHIQIAKFLIDAKSEVNLKSNDGLTPLHRAVANALFGGRPMVQLLIDSNADLNALDGDLRTPLLNACEHGAKSVIRSLLKARADLNYTTDGWTPIHEAIKSKDESLVKLLIEAKARIRGLEIPLLHAYVSRWPSVACKRTESFYHYLINIGADYSERSSNGDTTLMVAAAVGAVDVIEHLVRLKANVNDVNAERKTALHFAASNNQLEVAKVLLRLGADPECTDALNATPYLTYGLRIVINTIFLQISKDHMWYSCTPKNLSGKIIELNKEELLNQSMYNATLMEGGLWKKSQDQRILKRLLIHDVATLRMLFDEISQATGGLYCTEFTTSCIGLCWDQISLLATKFERINRCNRCSHIKSP